MPPKAAVKNSHVLLVGLARNCASTIHAEIETITRSFAGFRDVSWLIIESDSSDNSVEILGDIDDSANLKFKALGALQNTMSKRTERIAHCRNAYVQEINTNPDYANINYVAVVDMDGVNKDLTRAAVENCWGNGLDWDACFANQPEAYYDVWALRHPLWSPNDCWQYYAFLRDCGLEGDESLVAAVYSRMHSIGISIPPIQVDSAFGGLGIYRKEMFEACVYEGLDASGNEVCEHVSAHERMVEQGAKLYVMPSLVNGGWNEHTKALKFINRMRRQIKALAKKPFRFLRRRRL